MIGGRSLHRFHTRYGLELVRNALSFGLDVDIVADSENLAAELAYGAEERALARRVLGRS